MIAPSDNEYEEKLNKVNVNRFTRCTANMPIPDPSWTTAQMISAATLEGMIILRGEEKDKLKPKTNIPIDIENKLASTSINPFVRARAEILKKKSEFCRHEIERMEKAGNTDNRIYNEFAHEVRLLGEEFERKQYGS